jgi:acetolactate decarboxylase
MMQLEQKFIQALHALRHHRLHAPQRPIHEVYQSSTINALLERVSDGDMIYGQPRRHGDFGIGTFNALDGEMVGFDNRFWQITGDWRAHPVPDEYQTPFATVLFFNPRIQQTLDDPLDYAGLCSLLDGNLASANLFYAIRVDGQFRYVRTRSVPRQSKPYQPLTAATEDQPCFDLHRGVRDAGGVQVP